MVGEFKGVSVLRRAGIAAAPFTLSTAARSVQIVGDDGFSSSVKYKRHFSVRDESLFFEFSLQS